MESIALAAIRESLDAYLEKNLQLAEEACLREPQLDAIYQRKIQELQKKMREDPQHVTYFLYWYTVMKYLEKVCDYTLNIGEQAIFLITGRRLKFSQYQQLDRLISQETSLEYSFRPYYDGISGAVVARMENNQGMVLYKEGSKSKIAAEADKLSEWQKIFPSLTPKVITTTVQGDRETLLREFVAGDLLSELYLSDRNFGEKEEATRILLKVMIGLWELTLKEERPIIDYVDQIRSRLGEVYAMHPYLEYLAHQENLDVFLNTAKEQENSFSPSFSVWLHGDFNINNIVYHRGQVKFIDVHRSRYGDYLTDVGVFLVSIIRQSHLEDEMRQDMERVRGMLMDAVGNFAQKMKDEKFSSRLNLSLARSYITSSRVVVDEPHARWLFGQGIDLLKLGVNS
jgi:aminoglycoside phosphotransferase